jgi:hypothetical protein
MKNNKRAALLLPDLRNGQRGSVWFAIEARNVPGTLPALQWVGQEAVLALNGTRP